MSVNKEHLMAVGCPAAVADAAKAAGFSWLQLLLLAAKYGPALWEIVQAGLSEGKSFLEIIQELLKILKPDAQKAFGAMPKPAIPTN